MLLRVVKSNKTKPNLIDLLYVGIVICMKGYQIKLTENKKNVTIFFPHRKLYSFFTRSIIKWNLFICKFIHLFFGFTYWTLLWFFSFLFFLSHKNQDFSIVKRLSRNPFCCCCCIMCSRNLKSSNFTGQEENG